MPSNTSIDQSGVGTPAARKTASPQDSRSTRSGHPLGSGFKMTTEGLPKLGSTYSPSTKPRGSLDWTPGRDSRTSVRFETPRGASGSPRSRAAKSDSSRCTNSSSGWYGGEPASDSTAIAAPMVSRPSSSSRFSAIRTRPSAMSMRHPQGATLQRWQQ